MVFTWILVLITAMVHTRATNKPKRAKKNQDKGEFVSMDDSESETESEDWEKYAEEVEAQVAKAATVSKGKAPGSSKAKTPPTVADKRKAPLESRPMKQKTGARKRGSARGIEIQEPTAQMQSPLEGSFAHISSDRIKDFENRECIGERHVDVKALKDRSKAFGTLFDRAGLAPICTFQETTGYCLQMVRTFYQNATSLVDLEDGPKEFVTTVRNVKLKITPQLIGEMLGMKARVDGVHYLKGHVMTNTSWRVIVDGICLSDTRSAGNSIFSKELRPEYKFLHYVVCYNILPNMNTKVLRWDRMLFLYLLGNPAASMGSNFNIPYLIWSRMTKYIDNTRLAERLPFPMIIMRIFRKLHINTESTAYMHSLGTINDSTVVKSLTTKQDETPMPPRTKRSQATTTTTSASVSEEASITSIYREQRRMSDELLNISGRLDQLSAEHAEYKKKLKSLTKMVKAIFKNLGCSISDGSDSES